MTGGESQWTMDEWHSISCTALPHPPILSRECFLDSGGCELAIAVEAGGVGGAKPLKSRIRRDE